MNHAQLQGIRMMADATRSAGEIAAEEWNFYLDRREAGMDTQKSYDLYRDALDAAGVMPTLAGYQFRKNAK